MLSHDRVMQIKKIVTKLKIMEVLERSGLKPYISKAFLYMNDLKKVTFLPDIWKDYNDLKKKCPFLLEKINLDNNNKTILIVSLSEFIYQIKLEAMLGKALQLQGAKIKVLTNRHKRMAQRYFRLFGINEFVYFEDYFLSNSDFSEKLKEIKKLQSEAIDFQSAKKLYYEGCRVGQQALATLGRELHRGAPNLSDMYTKELFNKFFQDGVKFVHASINMLDDIKPDMLLFNEANYIQHGPIFDLGFKRNINIIQFIQPARDDSQIFKRLNQESRGLHPNSLSKSTFEGLINKPWDEILEKDLMTEFEERYGGKWFLSNRNQDGKIKKDKEEIINQLKLDRSKKNAVVFSHILWDANLFYGEDLFQDYEEWFVETVKAACKNPEVNWIIKLHPANVWKRARDGNKGELNEVIAIREKVGKLPEHIFLMYPETDINTFSLFDLADYAVTVRGTIGMEIPCFGKPVFTAGTGRYSGLGFTIDSYSKEEYYNKLSKIQNYPPLNEEEILLAKRHAYAVFQLRPWIMNSFLCKFNYRKQGSHPLDHNLIPKIKSKKELIEAEDLKQFAYWALNSRNTDYIQNWPEVK